uniref:acylphosphatase n=1 Tax=Glossina brevipalpis TaxID=37001 RepID=A0A1A9WFP8_9MUSC
MAAKALFAVDFEVFGLVQVIYQCYEKIERKHTVQQAKKLGLRGWCMNTRKGTVIGQLEGAQTQISEIF